MGTKLRSFRLSAGDSLALLTEERLSPGALVQRVEGPGFGAVIVFSGCVRDSEGVRSIRSITYEAYPAMVEKALRKIIQFAQRKWSVRLAVQHRLGRVPVGDASLIVACAGIHREESFEACRYVINEIKSWAPIWKVRFQ